MPHSKPSLGEGPSMVEASKPSFFFVSGHAESSTRRPRQFGNEQRHALAPAFFNSPQHVTPC